MNQLSWGELMLAGGLAGMVSWSVSSIFHPHPPPATSFPTRPTLTPSPRILQATFPLDVLKTRIQSVQPDPHTHQIPARMTLVAAYREAVRTNGMRVFYNGLAPTLIR